MIRITSENRTSESARCKRGGRRFQKTRRVDIRGDVHARGERIVCLFDRLTITNCESLYLGRKILRKRFEGLQRFAEFDLGSVE